MRKETYPESKVDEAGKGDVAEFLVKHGRTDDCYSHLSFYNANSSEDVSPAKEKKTNCVGITS